MTKTELNFKDVPYLYDRSGRIFLDEDRVYRIIEDEAHIENYKELLGSKDVEDLFSCGLVPTKILEERNSENLMILEHKKIPFILHPCEYSNRMFWQASIMFIELNLKLLRKGFITQDSHPWNISFDGNKPVFYDFGSIIKGNSVHQDWFNEFFKYTIVPIWLASYSTKTYNLAKEYRREHDSGLGLKLFNSTKLKRLFFKKVKSLSRHKNDPEKLFTELLQWLNKHPPISTSPQYWSEYYQNHDKDITKPKSIKQKFVYQILSENKPQKVLDLASNKGYYSYVASHLGASVMAFDYEEEIVDYLSSEENGKYNITPAHMDFNKPTAALGPGLFWEDSFKRFESDIVLALGLIHHICIIQAVPVYLFCQTLKRYATKGLVLEFVYPEDKYVASWNKPVPKDYSIKKIQEFMDDSFSNCQISDFEREDGLARKYLYFYK